MKKRYALLGSCSLFLVLFFQNCGKPPASSENGTSAGVVGSTQQYNKFSVDSFTTVSVWDFMRNRYLDVDLKTGKVTAFEEAGQVTGESFQLSAEKLASLGEILTGAEVCEPIVNPADLEGRACNMAYRYPYVALVDKSDEVRLGEKTSSCDVPIDLCGDKAASLKSWSTSLVEGL